MSSRGAVPLRACLAKDAAQPSCDSPNTSPYASALGASNSCQVGESPTCFVPALVGMQESTVRRPRPCMACVHPPLPPPSAPHPLAPPNLTRSRLLLPALPPTLGDILFRARLVFTRYLPRPLCGSQCSAAMTQSGEFVGVVQSAARAAGRTLTLLRTVGPAADHVTNPCYPDGAYLTGAFFYVS